MTLKFGPFQLDPVGRLLLRDGAAVPLGGRAFDLLVVLLEAGGQVVGKDVIYDRVWPGVTVEENNIQVQVSTLRKVLGEVWIQTVPGRGYRLAVLPAATTIRTSELAPRVARLTMSLISVGKPTAIVPTLRFTTGINAGGTGISTSGSRSSSLRPLRMVRTG